MQEEAEYIAADNPQAAVATVIHIQRTVALLADNPGLGRAGRVAGTRELIVPDTPYIVPYRVRGKDIDILRVFHARRRWPSAL
ncbi:type II toxin-antitoxin system RelE/ParE family toxin [Solimonas sp. K1W22B-7]|uniref:type II toxin-antitoxin system RelE/ParE family toxin n=1 Tax=Solimonas sp. K1W22B-7 TaxID=2303331 RepID=UPI00196933D4|nr:type II toxin-antitoxin system RelE/ParE family toxin [Solimonas sp. K1W22B-7]